MCICDALAEPPHGCPIGCPKVLTRIPRLFSNYVGSGMIVGLKVSGAPDGVCVGHNLTVRIGDKLYAAREAKIREVDDVQGSLRLGEVFVSSDHVELKLLGRYRGVGFEERHSGAEELPFWAKVEVDPQSRWEHTSSFFTGLNTSRLEHAWSIPATFHVIKEEQPPLFRRKAKRMVGRMEISVSADHGPDMLGFDMNNIRVVC